MAIDVKGPAEPAEDGDAPVRVVVVDLGGDTLLDHAFGKDATVREVKEHIVTHLEVPKAWQRLLAGTEVLEDVKLLAEVPEPRRITFVSCSWEQTLQEHNVPSEFWNILLEKRIMKGFRRTTKWEECDTEQRLFETDVDLVAALNSGRLLGGIGWTVELEGGSRFVNNPPLPRLLAGPNEDLALLLASGLIRADAPNAPQSGMLDKESWWVIPEVPEPSAAAPRRTMGAAMAAAAAAAFGGLGAAAGAEAPAEPAAAGGGGSGAQSAASSRVASKESGRGRESGRTNRATEAGGAPAPKVAGLLPRLKRAMGADI